MRDRLLRALAAGTVVLSIGLAAPAHAAPPAQATLAEVLRALKTDQLPADYVVLVDVSSSMQPAAGPDLYTAARQALRPLLGALSPVDRLHLIAFADRPDPQFSGPIGRAGAGVLGQLPTRAEGAHTDLGAAIEAALGIVDDPANTAPATVVLLTDGRQDAPPDSKYSGDLTAAIAALHRTAQGVERRRPVRALGIPLTGQTDVQLLDRVFDDTVLADLPRGQLGPYLKQFSDRVAVQKAAAYVKQDRLVVTMTPQPGPVTVLDEPVTVTATVHTAATRVPLTVTGVTATVDGVDLPVRLLAGDLTLAPGSPDQAVRLEVAPPTARQHWVGGRRITPGTLRIRATVDSPWHTVIANDLGLPFAPAPPAATVPVSAAADGFPVWLVVLLAAVLLVAALIVVLAYRRRWKSMSGGQLTVHEPGLPVPYRQRLSGRKVAFPAAHGSGTATRGKGVIRARRRRRTAGTGTELVLRIDYRRDGKRHRVSCRPRQTQALHDGTTFSYQP